jgi:hypothetical protein
LYTTPWCIPSIYSSFAFIFFFLLCQHVWQLFCVFSLIYLRVYKTFVKSCDMYNKREVLFYIIDIILQFLNYDEQLFIVRDGRCIWLSVARNRCRCMYYLPLKLKRSLQSNKGKVKTHKYINRQNQSTTGKLWKP